MRRWKILLFIASCAAFATPGAASARLPGSKPEPIPVVRYASEEELARHLSDAIAVELAGGGLHLGQARALFSSTESPQQDTVLHVRRLPSNSDRAPFRFELTERGSTPPRRWTVTLAGRMEQDALVAMRSVARGIALNCDDFQVQRRPWPAQTDQQSAPCSLPSNAVSRRFIAAGDTLRIADVGEQAAVGEMAAVTIKVAVGQVVLESPGLALENGNVGQRIRVRPGTSRQTVFATVTGPGSVTIEETGIAP